jgi:hypothetical protein
VLTGRFSLYKSSAKDDFKPETEKLIEEFEKGTQRLIQELTEKLQTEECSYLLRDV